MCAKLLQSCPSLCDPIDCSPPGSSVHGILQARGDLPDPGIELTTLMSSALDIVLCIAIFLGSYQALC